MSGFGRDLIESAREAVEIAEGRAEPARVVHVTDIDVAAIRRRLRLSQARFAERFGLAAGTVRDWEQGRRRPDQAAATLLKVIAFEPEAVDRALASAGTATHREPTE